MKTYRLRVSGRPVKHAYFFPADSPESASAAMLLASTQWGGIGSILVPYSMNAEYSNIYTSFLRNHSPDVAVLYISSKEDYKSIRKDLTNRIKKECNPSTPSIIDGKQYISEDRTKHAVLAYKVGLKDSKKPSLKYQTLQSKSNLPLNLAVYGGIFPGQEEMYSKHLSIENEVIDEVSHDFWATQVRHLPEHSPINLTSSNIGPLRVTGGGLGHDPFFTIVVVDTLNDLAIFWNIRSIQEQCSFRMNCRRTLLLPLDLVSEDSLSRIAHVIRSAPHIPGATSDIDAKFIIGNTDAAEIVKSKITDSKSIEILAKDTYSTNFHWGQEEQTEREADPGRTIQAAITNQVPLPQSYLVQAGGNAHERQVTLQAGSNHIEADLPSGFPVCGGSAILDVWCEAFEEYLYTPSLANLLQPNVNAYLTQYGLSRRCSINRTFQSITFNLPSQWEALVAYFGDQGYSIRLSRPGQYAAPIVDRLGGIQGISSLRNTLMYKLLSTLTVQSTKKIAQRIVSRFNLQDNQAEDIAQILGDIGASHELRPAPKNLGQLRNLLKPASLTDILGSLSTLLSYRLIRRGFLVSCPTCGITLWCSLERAKEQIKCDGCGVTSPLPLTKSSSEELQWAYSLNQLLNRVMDQDTLPHLYALSIVSSKYTVSGWTGGLELMENGKKQVIGEFDFTASGKNGLHVGECKAGAILEEKDIKSAMLASRIGASSFTFCSMVGFDENASHLVNELQQELDDSNCTMKIHMLGPDEVFR